MTFFRLTILAAVITLTGCSRAPVVTIVNRSTNVLTNIVLSGSGFSERIDRIAAGTERRITVRPPGESGLRIAFEAGGQRVDLDDLGYIEGRGGYRVTLAVQSDLKVSASSSLRRY
ncbi:MAG: hypothetical protein FJ405_16415 [Verrucomicrobia bacterium]|nr:hypothetical protein [Verrucomicrobiota bacterium]